MHGFIAIITSKMCWYNITTQLSEAQNYAMHALCVLYVLSRKNIGAYSFCPNIYIIFRSTFTKCTKYIYAMPRIPRRSSPRKDLNVPLCAVAASDAMVKHNASARSGDPTPRLRISSLLSAFILPDEVKL